MRPWLQIGMVKIGSTRLRDTEVLDMGRFGETAFFEVTIPAVTVEAEAAPPRSVTDFLTSCARTMVLGECAIFTLDDFAALDDKTKARFCDEAMHRGQHTRLPNSNAIVRLVFECDSFRIVRDGVEHHRMSRNGAGANCFGAFC
jgi:hypothetical protein